MTIICIDTFEHDDISGCYPATDVSLPVTSIADPPQLPATGDAVLTLGGFAAVILAAGVFFSWAARR